MKKNNGAKSRKSKWFEKYLPFISRSPGMQVDWLVSQLQRKTLSPQEIIPYIRLLLAADLSDTQHYDQVSAESGCIDLSLLFAELDGNVIADMLRAADIYEVPKLFQLLSKPTPEHAVIALIKVPPPYDAEPDKLINNVFQAIHDKSPDLLPAAAVIMKRTGEAPEHFSSAYQRFQEILKDQSILSALFPKART